MFAAFLRLGCISFGGPIAHLGYFQSEFVNRRRWCQQETFLELVALAQALPGPASSQVGFALGLLRAGWLGGIAAWMGFTAPSAILMLLFAFTHVWWNARASQSLLHGLQLVAVAVVAQAILSMQRSLAPDRIRMALALLATAVALFGPATSSTLLAIGLGAGAGLLLLHPSNVEGMPVIRLAVSKTAGAAAAIAFLTILLLSPLLPRSGTLAVCSAFYQTGALVFGGGHVVLPLLESAVVAKGCVDQATFLSGYGAAQAMPGPLFSFAAYLGAAVKPSSNSLLLGLFALVSIFLPGFLVLLAVLPFWTALRTNGFIQAALRGVSASVVGILIAAFFQPVWMSAVHTPLDFWIALVAFAFLTRWNVAPWIVVVTVVLASLGIASMQP